jgi:hypothetical protein
MKTMVSDNGNYKVSVEVNKVETDGKYCVRFATEYSSSKEPTQTMKKFEMFLTESELNTFRKSLAVE